MNFQANALKFLTNADFRASPVEDKVGSVLSVLVDGSESESDGANSNIDAVDRYWKTILQKFIKKAPLA